MMTAGTPISTTGEVFLPPAAASALSWASRFLNSASRLARSSACFFASASLSFLAFSSASSLRSEEHTSELQSLRHLVCRLLLEKKKNKENIAQQIQHKRRRDFGIHIAVRETKQKKVKLVHQHSTRTTLSADIKDIMYKTHTNTR